MITLKILTSTNRNYCSL